MDLTDSQNSIHDDLIHGTFVAKRTYDRSSSHATLVDDWAYEGPYPHATLADDRTICGTTNLATESCTIPTFAPPHGLHAPTLPHALLHLGNKWHPRHPAHAIKITKPAPNLAFWFEELSDRINNMQNWALVGKWHFSKMDDSAMRVLHSKWHVLLDYMPTVVRLLNGWYNFHFLCQEDLEKIQSIP